MTVTVKHITRRSSIGAAFVAPIGLIVGTLGWASFQAPLGAAAAAEVVPVENTAGIPPRSLGAYQAAIPLMPAECQMSWPVIAGIHEIESGHGTFSGDGIDRSAGPDAAGKAQPAPIIGVQLRGQVLNGEQLALIEDTDGGKLDGDTVYDRAVGFGQAIPETWYRVMVHFPGADPQDIDDAAVFTGLELCRAADGPVTDEANLRRAVYAYNHSSSYVEAVVANVRKYQRVEVKPGQPLAQASSEDSTDLGDLAAIGAEGWRTLWNRSRDGIPEPFNVPQLVLDGLAQATFNTFSKPEARGQAKQPAAPAGGMALPLPADVTGSASEIRAERHHDYPAVDFGADTGTPITAVEGGTATLIDNGRCGLGVRIEAAGGGRVWVYCHMSAVEAHEGAVMAGQRIGQVGSTGNSTGPHLHLDLHVGGELVCPAPYLADIADGIAPDFERSTTDCVS